MVQDVPRWYRATRALARVLVRAYYPDLVVTGAERVPDGPLIVAANHPNSLIDPLILSACLPRKVHWLAKAPLFEHALARRFLVSFGVIPVHRRHEGGTRDTTSATLRAAADAILAGHAVGIFPEGMSHDATRLQPLKTGVGRIAVLATEGLPEGVAVTILPVVLHFADKARFRSEAVVAVAEPVRARRGDSPDDLTALVRERLEGLLVHVEDEEQEALLHDVRALHLPRLAAEAGAHDPEGRHRVERETAAALRRFAGEEPERVQAFARRLRAYRDLLVRNGLVPSPPPSPGRLAAALALLPVAVWGALHSWLPYRLTGWIAARRWRRTDRTTVATYQLTWGFLILPLAWVLESVAVAAWRGPLTALAFLVTAPVTGLAARWSFQALRGLLLRLRDHVMLGAEPAIAEVARREADWLWSEVERWRRKKGSDPFFLTSDGRRGGRA
jgi:1-acyl-sn-glycerol-3-phosphate acyltransferase